jgi:HSP20 family protein
MEPVLGPASKKKQGAIAMKMNVTFQRRGSVLDRIEAVQRQITERAFELFNRRGGSVGRSLDDWLAAERETIWKPPVEVVEKDGEFLVEAAIAGVPPKEMDVQITAEELLIQGNGAHRHRPGEIVHSCEFRPGRVFRTVRFPRRIDPDKVRAEYHDGLLRVWAPAAKDAEARKVELDGSMK